MIFNKWLIGVGLIAVLLAVLIIPGCADEEMVEDLNGEDVAAPADAEYVLKLQHSWGAAENHFFEHYAQIVENMSNGRMKIEVFSEGELVDTGEIPDAVSSGIIDMGHTHPQFHLDVLDEGYIEYVPFLWRDVDEVMAALWHYGVADLVGEAVEDTFDVVVLDFQVDDLGALLFSSPVRSIDDMAGMTINIDPPLADVLRDQADASAVYYDAEDLWYNLNMGILDGLEWGGAKAMVDMDLHSAAVSGGVAGEGAFVRPYFITAFIPFYCINPDVWNDLPEDLQHILMEAVHANTIWMRSYYGFHEAESMRIMEEAGIEIVDLPDEDVELMFNESLEWLESDFAPLTPRTQKIYEAVMKALEDFGRI